MARAARVRDLRLQVGEVHLGDDLAGAARWAGPASSRREPTTPPAAPTTEGRRRRRAIQRPHADAGPTASSDPASSSDTGLRGRRARRRGRARPTRSGRGAAATPVAAAIALPHPGAGGSDRRVAARIRRPGPSERTAATTWRAASTSARHCAQPSEVRGVGGRRGSPRATQREHVGVRVLHRSPPTGCAAGPASGGCDS